MHGPPQPIERGDGESYTMKTINGQALLSATLRGSEESIELRALPSTPTVIECARAHKNSSADRACLITRPPPECKRYQQRLTSMGVQSLV